MPGRWWASPTVTAPARGLRVQATRRRRPSAADRGSGVVALHEPKPDRDRPRVRTGGFHLARSSGGGRYGSARPPTQPVARGRAVMLIARCYETRRRGLMPVPRRPTAVGLADPAGDRVQVLPAVLGAARRCAAPRRSAPARASDAGGWSARPGRPATRAPRGWPPANAGPTPTRSTSRRSLRRPLGRTSPRAPRRDERPRSDPAVSSGL
jgi:hypothetical protein